MRNNIKAILIMIKLLSIFLISCSINQAAFAFDLFNGKLNVYRCSSEAEAKSCSKCNIDKSIKLDFKIDVKNSSILAQSYEGKELTNSATYEKCKIFDKKNWECGEGYVQDDVSTSNYKQGMNNGVYYHVHEFSVYISNKNLPSGVSSIRRSYGCAK